MSMDLETARAAYVGAAVAVARLDGTVELWDLVEARVLARNLEEALAVASRVAAARSELARLAAADTEPAPPPSDPYIEIEAEAPLRREA